MAVKNTIEIFKYIYTNKAMYINMEWLPISGLKFAYTPYVWNQKEKAHEIEIPHFFFFK